MHTKIVKLSSVNLEQGHLKEAAEVIITGGLVIMPTETVYGIAANMLRGQALERLYEIKKRPKHKPFTLHIHAKEEIEKLAREIPVSAYKLIDKFWPGPLTLILKAKGEGTVGLRMPDNEIALAIIALAGVPVVCASANISGYPAPVNFKEAIKDLDGLVNFAIDAGETSLGLESSIVDLSAEPLRVLRAGAIKKEDIEAQVKKKTILFICTGNSCRSVMAKALLEKMLREGKRDDVEVLSAGTMLEGGLSASEETEEVLRQEGLDVSGHRSKGVTADMIKKSDIILVMDKSHEERILGIVPEAKKKLFLLKEFAKIGDNNLNIPDPIGRPLEFYEQTLETIKEAVKRVAEII